MPRTVLKSSLKGMPYCYETNARVDGDIFAVPSKVYPAAVQLLSLASYRSQILTGFVVSAGGLGESLVPTSVSPTNLDSCRIGRVRRLPRLHPRTGPHLSVKVS